MGSCISDDRYKHVDWHQRLEFHIRISVSHHILIALWPPCHHGHTAYPTSTELEAIEGLCGTFQRRTSSSWAFERAEVFTEKQTPDRSIRRRCLSSHAAQVGKVRGWAESGLSYSSDSKFPSNFEIFSRRRSRFLAHTILLVSFSCSALGPGTSTQYPCSKFPCCKGLTNLTRLR